MATYDFILSGVDAEMALQGAASTDAEAWREAILFLSEMLREKPVREGGAFSLQSAGSALRHIKAWAYEAKKRNLARHRSRRSSPDQATVSR